MITTETGPGRAMSPRIMARLAGAVFLVSPALTGILLRGKVIVAGDPAATATNILTNELHWRIAGVTDLLAAAGETIVALLLFLLLASVSRPLSLLSVFFRLTHVSLYAMTAVLHFAALAFLSGAVLKGLTIDQVQALAFALLRVHGIGHHVALFFFGAWCITIGALVARSSMIPRVLGVWMGGAGAAYVLNSVVHFIAPGYGAQFFRWAVIPAGVGELALMLWLLIMGVKDSSEVNQ